MYSGYIWLNHRIGVVGVHQTDIPKCGLGNLNRNRPNNNLLVNYTLKNYDYGYNNEFQRNRRYL